MEQIEDILKLVDNRAIYQEIFSTFARKLLKLPSVESVYRIGSWAAPGNSDIDLIIFVKDDSYLWKIREIFESLSGVERFILYQHPPMVLPVDFKPWVAYIRPVDELIGLDGSRLRLRQMGKEDLEHAFIEILLTYYPKIWYRLAYSCCCVVDKLVYDKLKVIESTRFPLQAMHALSFVLDIFLQLYDIDLLKFFDWEKLNMWRKRYLKISPSKVCGYVVQSLPRLLSLTALMFKFAHRRFSVEEYVARKKIVVVGDRVFSPNVDTWRLVKTDLRGLSGVLFYVLPVELFVFWNAYSGLRSVIMLKYKQWMEKLKWWGMYAPLLYRVRPFSLGDLI